MPNSVSDKIQDILAQSLVLVERHKDEIMERMEVALRGAGGRDEAFGQSEVSAMLLVQLLIDQARNVVDGRGFVALHGLAVEHRALEIDGRHYSRFGDALTPILYDALGPRLPREVAAAWCDAFWALVGAFTAQSQLEDA